MRRSTTLRMSGALLVACAILVLAACAPVAGHMPNVEMAAVEHDERNTTVQITNFTVPGPAAGGEPTTGVNRVGSVEVPVRAYEPGDHVWATLVWAHGGSFMRGTLDWPEADWVARKFAACGIRVVSVDYILAADDVKAPAPSNDLSAVVAWAAAEFDGPLVVGGASAGAHLAVIAAVEQADRSARGDARAADALILEYPTLHRVQRAHPELAAAAENLEEQRRFRADRIAEMYEYYLGSNVGDLPANELARVMVAGELPATRLATLPPTVIVNADTDELRASGEEFAEQLSAAGIEVAVSLQPGTVHGYLNRPEESRQARIDATETIDRFVRELTHMLER